MKIKITGYNAADLSDWVELQNVDRVEVIYNPIAENKTRTTIYTAPQKSYKIGNKFHYEGEKWRLITSGCNRINLVSLTKHCIWTYRFDDTIVKDNQHITEKELTQMIGEDNRNLFSIC